VLNQHTVTKAGGIIL